MASSPASSASGLSTGMATMVVQFGLATMPMGRSSSSWALTSGTTRGTRSSMRNAEELSMTTGPEAAMRSARAFDAVAPADASTTSRSE